MLLQVVGKVSLAAKGLCLWVRAMETYGTVAKDVAPKRNKLKTAQDNLSKKQTALAAAQTQLAEVLAKVQALKVRLHPNAPRATPSSAGNSAHSCYTSNCADLLASTPQEPVYIDSNIIKLLSTCCYCHGTIMHKIV